MIPTTVLSWLLKPKVLIPIIIGIVMIGLFFGYRYYKGKSEKVGAALQVVQEEKKQAIQATTAAGKHYARSASINADTAETARKISVIRIFRPVPQNGDQVEEQPEIACPKERPDDEEDRKEIVSVANSVIDRFNGMRDGAGNK